MGRDRIGRCLAYGFFNLFHHLWRMTWRAHPMGSDDLALLVYFNIQYAYSMKHGRQAPFKDAGAIEGVEVFGRINSVFVCRSRT